MEGKLLFYILVLVQISSICADWSTRSLNDECSDNLKCQVDLGHLSICNTTLSPPACQCYDTQSGGKKQTVMFRSRCYHRKMVGDYCDVDEECEANLGHSSLCEDGRCGEGSASLNSIKMSTIIIALVFSTFSFFFFKKQL